MLPVSGACPAGRGDEGRQRATRWTGRSGAWTVRHFTTAAARGSATFSTSSSVATGTNCIVLRTSAGSSREVGLVERRQDERLDAVAPRRQRLLADAADRQHQAAQRDLAGHRHVLADRSGCCSADTIAVAIVTPADGPSFGNRAGRHVDVQIVLVEEIRRRRRARSAIERMWLTAARADSCITLPSCPVSVMLPWPPGSRLASMNSTSPPLSVHATPVATPGRETRNATSSRTSAGRDSRAASSAVDDDARRRACRRPSSAGHARGDLARDRADLPLEVAHAGLARVLRDHPPQRVVVDRDLIGGAGRAPRADAASGTAARCAPSLPRCSRRAR